ncbi:unnamed protein product [Paramecium octaurelia]|uniref:Uncharacterized protein n=1 Tax=Paramecium octaurelia TaxID=43137 RepID=A0A8S1YFP7_PAROT|nr:unnamed protein product [Paramecium octaurelia]
MVCLRKKDSYQMAMEKSILANLLLLNFKYNLNMAFLRMMQETKDQKPPLTKIIIIDVQTGLQDIQTLENNRRLTSSIIDAYILYLNLESEKFIFQRKKQIDKISTGSQFLPTTLTTNFVRNCTAQHAKNIFEVELLQFYDLNYDLKKIYSQIGMTVNKNKYYCYFLLFDLKQNGCPVFDSLQKPTDQMNRLTLYSCF